MLLKGGVGAFGGRGGCRAFYEVVRDINKGLRSEEL